MAGRVYLKAGVDLSNLAPAGFVILAAVKQTARTLDRDLTITAGRNGTHAPTSAHYQGEALDVRSKTLTPAVRAQVLPALMALLGPTRFFGFLEDAGTDNEHFHIQRKKGTTFDLKEWLRDG